MKNDTFMGLVILAAMMVLFVIVSYFPLFYSLLPSQQGPKPAGVSNLEWRLYKAKNGSFSAKFPAIVLHATDTQASPSGDKVINTYVSEQHDGSIYMVSVITFPKESQSDDEYHSRLTDVMKGLLKGNPDNIAWGISYGKFLNFDDLTFGIENKEQMMINKVFLKGKDLYLLSYAAKKNLFEQANFQAFLDNFQITQTGKTTQGG